MTAAKIDDLIARLKEPWLVTVAEKRRISSALADLKAENERQAAIIEAVCRCGYVMSEPHQSGYRVILGFPTLESAQEAQRVIARAALTAWKRQPAARSALTAEEG